MKQNISLCPVVDPGVERIVQEAVAISPHLNILSGGVA